ncbi:MAG: 16S rRNA (cytidine(1402)-2'-O)-methyltransferase, partial [Desulfovibrionaceae bacterium]|nr:16S rRNA (cytidine(1402)-2'-O)-methyltransferase [Desulfovibrionaceae bacterium]
LIRLEQHATLSRELPGEITVIIGPPEMSPRTPQETLLALLHEEAAPGGKPREVARRVQARVTGWTGKEIYALLQTREEN